MTGGQSRRLGGSPKALMPLAGEPMIHWVINRMKPQVDYLLLSVEQPAGDFESFGLPQVADPLPGNQGPLGGLCSALKHVRRQYEWLLLAPCDAPFLPLDLAGRLRDEATAANKPGAVVRWESELQPTFSLWNRDVYPELEQAVTGQGMSGFKQFLRVIDLAELDWRRSSGDSGSPPFFNINDRQALEWAGRLLQATDRT